MRRKKHKHTRKSVSFYKVNYGFREPYKVRKSGRGSSSSSSSMTAPMASSIVQRYVTFAGSTQVLLDGNFIHATLAANMPHLQDLLSRLLGGDVKLFTTPCISKELKSMGADFAATTAAARQQQLHKCEHQPALTPSDCLLAAVSHGNPQHWWIASQDKALQTALAGMQAVPVLFASVNGLHLAEPPEQAKAAVAAGHAAAQTLPKHERAAEPLKDLHELRPKDDSWKKFKRKKVKGPNPLAVKKKQTKPAGAQPQTTTAAAAAAADREDKSGKRKRKKNKQQQQQQEQNTGGGDRLE